MERKEQWMRWQPADNLRNGYYIDSTCNDKNGLKIVLIETENAKKAVTVLFDSGIYCYRDTYETYTHSRMLEACERQGRELFYGTNFFKVTNSDYIKWVSEQSGGISNCQPLEHFVIFTQDSMVEILAYYEPRVEFIDLP